MASFSSEMTKENITGFLQSSTTNLAVIHFKVKKTSDVFAKVEIETSLDANWQIMYKGKPLLLDKITVQIGYANDNGEMTYKNSALIVNQSGLSQMAPMIWMKENSQNVYHATYTASQSLSLQLNYSVTFKLNEDLPKELQDAYKGQQTIMIDATDPFSDYSVKVSII